MTNRTLVAVTITSAAALAGAAPLVGQMPHPGGGGTGHEVTISDTGYIPGDMVVAPGQAVLFTNKGVNVHNVTADAGAFASPDLSKGGTFNLTAPATPGTYAYHCTFHVNLRGSVVVSTLTLTGPKKVLVGKTAAVRGVAPTTPPGTPVSLERLVGTTWTPLATTALAADGSYAFTTPKLTGVTELRTVIGSEISPTLAIPVAPKVAAKKKAGQKLTLTVTVTPKAGGKAKVERLNTSSFKWTRVKQFTVARSGKATVKVPKAGKYRVTLLATPKLAEASSATVTFS